MNFLSKKIRKILLFSLVLSFLFLPDVISADTATGLNVPIESNGDVPAVSIACIEGHNYTLTLVHRDEDVVNHSYGSVERKYCSDGVITFSGFNINTKLEASDPTWWNWFYSPLEYIIKDSTGANLPFCDVSSCTLLTLHGAFNSYNKSVYLASSTYWTTVGAGPVFYTDDHLTWSNSANGDGSLNYVAPPTYSNVLFLPGVKASRLYRERVINCTVDCEDQLWEPNGDSDVEYLFMSEEGTSLNDDIYTRDVVDEAYDIFDVYKDFIQSLGEMKEDGTIADYSAVPYDWRLSLEDLLQTGTKSGENISYIDTTTTPYILSELERMADSSDNGKVTIVAHSNGGLVTKALLIKLAEENNPLLQKIDKVIFVAVPHLGTPMAIPALLHGYEQGIPTSMPIVLSDKTARQFGLNLPIAYHLLPSDKYFTYVDNSVVTFDQSMSDWGEKYGVNIHSKELLHNFLVDDYGRVDVSSEDVDTPISLKDTLLSYAETKHIDLDDWIPPSHIEVSEIAGWGVPTTISGVEYTKEDERVIPNPITTIDGDGTVVIPSVLWSNGVEVDKYWVNLMRYNKDNVFIDPLGVLKKKHHNILEIDEVQTLINNIVLATSTDILPTYISNSAPVSGANDTRLIYSVHSPITLNIYDSLGNHTGISTTTNKLEEEIPGTYYMQWGGAKYLYTNTGNPMNIDMTGTETGTFTFKIEQKQGDNSISSVIFQDIPVSSTSRVKMTITDDINTLSNLIIDNDGDGEDDIVLTPVVDGIVTYTPPQPSPLSTEILVYSPPPSPVGGGPIYQGADPVKAPEIIVEPIVEISIPEEQELSLQVIPVLIEEEPVPVLEDEPALIEEEKNDEIEEVEKIDDGEGVVEERVVELVEQTAQVISSDTGFLDKVWGFVKGISYWLLSIFK